MEVSDQIENRREDYKQNERILEDTLRGGEPEQALNQEFVVVEVPKIIEKK